MTMSMFKIENYSIIHFVKIAIFIIKSNSSESFSLFQKSLKVAHKIPLLIIIKLKLIHDHKREIFLGANFHFEICTLHAYIHMYECKTLCSVCQFVLHFFRQQKICNKEPQINFWSNSTIFCGGVKINYQY